MNGKIRPDRSVYVRNRSKVLAEDLLPYENQWVAWSADGSRIVAHHADPTEALRLLDAAGIDREDVNLEWIPPGGEIETLL
jgi:hypothetical protein